MVPIHLNVHRIGTGRLSLCHPTRRRVLGGMVAAMARTIDPDAAAGEILRLGTIASVDHANATCTVECGDMLTGDIPWIAQRAGKVRHWSPPAIGEQCLLLAPEGDLAAGLAVVGLYSDACPPPSANPDIVLVEYDDGAVISYDQATHALTAILPAGATARIEADGGIAIRGDVTIDGDVTVSGDVVADGISLRSHRHGDVQGGTAQSGGPVR